MIPFRVFRLFFQQGDQIALRCVASFSLALDAPGHVQAQARAFGFSVIHLYGPPKIVLSPGMGADWSSTAHNFLTRPPTGIPRRAISPSEESPRPRVARAQKIIRLHPLLLLLRIPPIAFVLGEAGFRSLAWFFE